MNQHVRDYLEAVLVVAAIVMVIFVITVCLTSLARMSITESIPWNDACTTRMIGD